MLSTIDPLSPVGRATHAQRRRRFLSPSFPVLQVDFARETRFFLNSHAYCKCMTSECFAVPVRVADTRACALAGAGRISAHRGPCSSPVHGQAKSIHDMGPFA